MANEPAAGPPKDLPRWIGPYRVERELGRGRLGPVVGARHGPTGDEVALRVVKPEWACLPKYVARLTRDAFAAAQFAHPNLVRLLDLGEAQGRVFFASEFADGTTLADRMARQGALPPREAVALVLQAARGLRYAHGHGLPHGDVRPANILVGRDGMTRVADLGLTRTPGSVDAEEVRETRGPVALGGQPEADAFMERVQTDLRGLGRTLAHLLTNNDGDASPTGLIAAGLPMNLVELVRSLAEPRPGADLNQAVPALEKFLAARGPGASGPREDDTRVLAECLTSYRASPSARLRSRIVLAGLGSCALLVLVTTLARHPLVAATFLGLGLMTAAARFVVLGVTRRAEPFPRVRALVVEGRANDLLTGLAALALFVTALVVLHLLAAWIVFGILALVLALGLHFTLDRRVEAERRGAVEEAEALLKGLRLQGVGEDSVRRFVLVATGDDPSGFYEALFGEEARRAAREAPARGPIAFLHRFRDWRDVVTPWVEARHEARRRARDGVFLQAIEERGLVSEGVNLLTARRKARRIAAAMVATAAEIRWAEAEPDGPDRPTVARAVRSAAETPEQILAAQESGLSGPDPSRVVDFLTGPRARFLLGAVMVAGCLAWVHQNGVISGDQIKDVAARAIDDPDPLRAIRDARIDVRLPARGEPLSLPYLPRVVAGLFRDFGSGAAGLILILSAFLRGSRVAYFAFPGAALALFGARLGLPGLGPFTADTTGMVVGAGVAFLAALFGKAAGD